jgi:hypothetical protein
MLTSLERLINELEVTMLDNIILQISLIQIFVSREKRRYKNKAAKDNPTSNPIQIPAALSQYTTPNKLKLENQYPISHKCNIHRYFHIL